MLGAAAVFEYGAGGFDGPKIFFFKEQNVSFLCPPVCRASPQVQMGGGVQGVGLAGKEWRTAG